MRPDGGEPALEPTDLSKLGWWRALEATFVSGGRIPGSSIHIYSDDNCTISIVSSLKDQSLVNRWEPVVDAIQTPSEARTGQLRCTTFSGVTGEFDLAFLKSGVVSEF